MRIARRLRGFVEAGGSGRAALSAGAGPLEKWQTLPVREAALLTPGPGRRRGCEVPRKGGFGKFSVGSKRI